MNFCILHILVFLASVLFFLCVTGEKGYDCEFNTDCNSTDLWCTLGSCQCIAGVLYNKTQCLLEANYNEACISDEQCQGLRCAKDPNDSQFKCLCEELEAYDYKNEECIYLNSQLRFIMSKKETVYGGGDVIPTLTGLHTWNTIRAALILVMVCFILAILSTVTFCCYISYSDNKLRKFVSQVESRVGHYQKLSSNVPNEDPSTSAAFLEPIVVAQPVPIDVSIHFE